jgi:hypothetical protein
MQPNEHVVQLLYYCLRNSLHSSLQHPRQQPQYLIIPTEDEVFSRFHPGAGWALLFISCVHCTVAHHAELMLHAAVVDTAIPLLATSALQ